MLGRNSSPTHAEMIPISSRVKINTSHVRNKRNSKNSWFGSLNTPVPDGRHACVASLPTHSLCPVGRPALLLDLRDCYPLHTTRRLNEGWRTHFWHHLSPQKTSSLTFRVSPRPVVVVTGQVTRAFRMMKISGQDDLWWPNGCQKWILRLKPRLVWTLWGSLWSDRLIFRVCHF